MTNVVQVTHAQIPAWRLRRQSLAPHTTAAPEELAERLAGVQAQVPSAAEPALATRRTEPAAGAVRVAQAAHSVVGTWGMRDTLRLLPTAGGGEPGGWLDLAGGPRGAEWPGRGSSAMRRWRSSRSMARFCGRAWQRRSPS
ncbi:hypothetical protein ACWIG3_04070 [Streptomyces celluloflavus]